MEWLRQKEKTGRWSFLGPTQRTDGVGNGAWMGRRGHGWDGVLALALGHGAWMGREHTQVTGVGVGVGMVGMGVGVGVGVGWAAACLC